MEVEAENVIKAGAYGSVTINESGDNTIVLNGDIVFAAEDEGDPVDATVNITLSGEDSSWEGRSYVADRTSEVTGFTLNVTDGASVTTTGDSFANTLGLAAATSPLPKTAR